MSNKIKEWEVTFTIGRVYDAEGLTKAEVKEMALQDFYDDARHGNLTITKTTITSRRIK